MLRKTGESLKIILLALALLKLAKNTYELRVSAAIARRLWCLVSRSILFSMKFYSSLSCFTLHPFICVVYLPNLPCQTLVASLFQQTVAGILKGAAEPWSHFLNLSPREVIINHSYCLTGLLYYRNLFFKNKTCRMIS